jgi:hypothetical protein
MVESVSKRSPSPTPFSAFQPHPGALGLAGLVELLTIVPLDANPDLRKIVSVPMSLDEILQGRERFEIVYAAA